ncbi:uncharacterized protein Pyn_23134 [Prunus yedoensis var. nudiflora]|uniref:Aminotransferase-like plant mobile domain-containing protein n=1 Tax=Prunus yedoensis var. nudiflora TaxID=2094558 RepID=A0A314YZV2_PRUYE|nr:uncharacterized protein Pyn_23134 [Prunus yedoensis var. nudiflora]
MKPKHGGPLWAFQFWLHAYFPELRGSATPLDTEPLANALARSPRKHNATAFCFKFFYNLAETTGSQFRMCLTRSFPLFLAHDLSVIPDGDLGLLPGRTRSLLQPLQGRGRGLFAELCGEAVRPNPDGLPSPLSINRLSSWRADVGQNHDVAGITFQLQKGLTFLTLTPWMHRNAIDEDGRVWYEDYISARFTRPVEETVRGPLTNVDWDPLPPKVSRGKKAPAIAARPNAQTVARSRVPAAASITTPPPKATIVVTMPRTLALKTIPSPPPVRSSDAVGRKRSREVTTTEVVREAEVAEVVAEVGDGVQAAGTAVEEEFTELSRKRLLLVLSEGDDEEEAPPATDEVPEGEAAAAVESLSVVKIVPSLAATAPIEPSPIILRRPSGIVIRSPPRPSLPMSTAIIIPSTPVASVDVPLTRESSVEAELAVQGSSVVVTSSPSPTAPVNVPMPQMPLTQESTVMTELVAVGASTVPPAIEEPTSSNDLAELYANLHEEGGSSASVTPLDDDSKATIERLREFLFMGVNHMANGVTFEEFRSCLDTAMALCLLDLAQLDELEVRLA